LYWRRVIDISKLGAVNVADLAFIFQDKLENVLQLLAENSIHSCITDPPYHLTIEKRFGKKGAKAPKVKEGADKVFARAARGFMGEVWDGGDIAFRPETWQAVNRVLMNGGHMSAFGGARTYHRMACAIEDGLFEIRTMIPWIYGSGFPSGNKWMNEEKTVGTLIKPANEPICVARKALYEKSITAQYKANGCGGLGIDDCRVPPAENDRTSYGIGGYAGGMTGNTYGKWEVERDEYKRPEKGRWPPNVVLAHSIECTEGECVDGCPVLALAKKAKFFPSFYYCAKASKKEKEAGLEELEYEMLHRVNSGGLENEPRFAPAERKNIHPTAKPLGLMRWLIRMFCPPDGIVLDPFMGSGSTGVAAILEGRRFVGIEMIPSYYNIAKHRIQWASKIREAACTV